MYFRYQTLTTFFLIFGFAWSVTSPTVSPANGQNELQTAPPSTPEDATPRMELPISIVEAAEYSDGGTIFVILQDAQKHQLLMCISQQGFESPVPGNTLFFNARHPMMEIARLPFSKEEATQAITALEAAVNSEFTPEERKSLAQMGDPLETMWYEQATKPRTAQRSKREWRALFAFDALRRLKRMKDLPTMDAAGAAPPPWYAKYDKERQARLATERRERELDERFKGFYPEAARRYFTFGPEARKFDDEEATQRQGQLLADAVGDPVQLAVASCKALGSLSNNWTMTESRDRIAIAAVETVGPEAFSKSLGQIEDDRTALLGAGRVYFALGLGNRLSKSDQAKWTTPIAEVVLNDGEDDNKVSLLRYLAREKHPKVVELLRRVARGETGTPIDQSKQWDQEPGMREAAYLSLASRKDGSVKVEIVKLLPQATLPQNRAALEVALALLGDPQYLKKEHFQLESHNIGMAGLQAIEQFQGRHGMDELMTSALDAPWAAVANEAMLVAQRLTGQVWVPPNSNHQPRNLRNEAKAWWSENGEAFKKRMTVQAADQRAIGASSSSKRTLQADPAQERREANKSFCVF